MVDTKLVLDTLLGAVASKNGTTHSGGLADLLGAALGGSSSASSGNSGGLGDLLGSALSDGTSASSSSGGLADLLNAALNGSSSTSSGSHGGLGDLLGSALSGGASSTSHSGTSEIGDLLNAALGGSSTSTARSGGASASGGLLDLVKDAVINNPAMAKTIAAGAAGLLLGTKSGRALSSNAVKLGGIALIGTLAYKSLKSFQETSAGKSTELALPKPDQYVPAASKSEDSSLRLVRAMIAAALADGTLDASEKERIAGGLAQSGDVSEWLKKEMAKPAKPEDLAKGVTSIPEAAEIYTAARVAIEPDSDGEIDFLNQLADALNLNPALVAELDKSATSVKVPA